MYHHFSHYYNLIFPEDPKVKDFIKSYARPHEQALDLGCGTGRLTFRIHENNMVVKGIDLDETMIEVARKNYPNLDFEVGDMTEVIKSNQQYTLITCFGNTLPHLSRKLLQAFFVNVEKSLTHDGIMMIQMLNYDLILKEKPQSLKKIVIDSVEFERRYHYLNHEIEFETILKIDHHETRGKTKLYPYRLAELTEMIKHAGLDVVFLGNLDAKPFEMNDYYLYIIISKN
jgi:2-polyprenyl-3-methyl-5-hydroxy-6-metoxy-1,4-benzoquinol methylase